MRFTVVDELPFEREKVFTTHRDKIEELVQYMPNVDSIVTKEREEDGDIVRLVNLWKAAESEIPSVARPFIKPDMLQWEDRAEWDGDFYEVAWEIELGFLPGVIDARGHSEFEDFGDETRVTIDGEITVDASKLPGVPGLMEKRVAKALENFVVNLIKPNLKETNEIIERYLRENE
jgi:hypothetical protein